MKDKKKKAGINLDLGSLFSIHKLHLDRLNPLILIGCGAGALLVLAVLLFAGGSSQQENEATLKRAQQSMGQVRDMVQNIRRVMEDEQVQELAVMTASDPGKLNNLEQYVSGRIPDLIDVKLFGPDMGPLRGKDLGANGYAVLDLLLTVSETGQAPAQIHGVGDAAYITLAVRVGEETAPVGYLMANIKPSAMLSVFSLSMSSPGTFALDQYNGRFKPKPLSAFAEPPTKNERLVWLRIPASLFRIGVKQGVGATSSMGILRPLFFFVGVLFLTLGVMLKLRPYKPPQELKEDPQQPESLSDSGDRGGVNSLALSPATPEATSETTGESLVAVELPDIGFDLEKIHMPRKKPHPPVELVDSIFRAYDIRGIVDETLDSEVARRVGQVVGSLALEADAGPVIVARDGRDSGPDLVQGMIEGVASTGCDVIDIGAVPTGVLYFAAYELSKGTGVMVTGSHNPPEYNGIKMVIGGITQAGDQITGMYDRIKNGNLRVGKGKVSQQKMLKRYRKKIAGDIQLKRPLKVAADCGNGIGGVVAADVLRDIGAEVITLFDEVDGTFPNHHPDPSEPENLVDLIEAVKLMDADIGVAFDGDADRLGVVTSDGEIIYSDRLMMLFVEDVLSRVPDSTIIYDVKCTGHLHEVIENAGGKAMMYKTGHSLIKNKMKEVNAPFAGEMSGHFFFKERWYGFDCGIYSAARLLEILAADERDVKDVLNGLPNSVSTPELKLYMEEGENHAFVEVMQEKARFADAKITTIDGIRADFADGWGLVRASNTTPILVLRFDADSEAALQRIKDMFRQQRLAINKQLKLPF
jgi:phosphomannomutase